MMGGKYFVSAAQPLQVPRMGQMVYYVMKNRIIENLKQHFLRVDCPIEAPEKDTFGDIDIVLQAPISARGHDGKEFYELLLKVLEPERLHTDSQNTRSEGDLMYHAAIPWPEDVPEKPSEALKPGVRLSLIPFFECLLLFPREFV